MSEECKGSKTESYDRSGDDYVWWACWWSHESSPHDPRWLLRPNYDYCWGYKIEHNFQLRAKNWSAVVSISRRNNNRRIIILFFSIRIVPHIIWWNPKLSLLSKLSSCQGFRGLDVLAPPTVSYTKADEIRSSGNVLLWARTSCKVDGRVEDFDFITFHIFLQTEEMFSSVWCWSIYVSPFT